MPFKIKDSLQIGNNTVVNNQGVIQDEALANLVTSSTYTQLTVDSKGRVINGANPTTLAGYGILDSVNQSIEIIAGTGLSGGGDLSANRTLNVDYGTTAGTACQGNDTRLDNIVYTPTQVATGDGLLGGGDLTTNRTLTVDSTVVRTSRTIMFAGDIVTGGGDLSSDHVITLNHDDIDITQLRNYSSDNFFTKENISALYQPDGTNPFVYTDNAGVIHIDGDIIQNGTTYTTNVEEVLTANALIITRDGATAAIEAGDISGLRVKKYDGVSDLIFGTDADGYFKVGEEGSLQILSTREDAPVLNGVPIWNDTLKQFATDSNLTWSSNTLTAPTFAGELAGNAATVTNGVYVSREIATGDRLLGGGDLSANRTLTVDNTVVRTSGDQTLAGVKTFSSTIQGSISGNSETVTNGVYVSREVATGDGLSGGGNLSANRTLTVDNTVIRTTGDQTLAGTKTFSDLIVGDISGNAATVTDGVYITRQVATGDGLLGGGDLSANRTIAVDNTVVRTAGAQTIAGVKTFSDGISGSINGDLGKFEEVKLNNTVSNGYSTTSVGSTNAIPVDTWAVSAYRSCKYLVQITQGTNYQASEIMLVQNGTTTTMTEYGVVETNGTIGEFTADISSGNARLVVTMGSADTATVKIAKTLITV